MATISEDYRRLGESLWQALGQPSLDGIYLPAPVADETFRDEFGFVFLSDGSVGPFYVSMGEILPALWARFPDPARRQEDGMRLLNGFNGGGLAERALALGLYNALSASVFRRAGFQAPARASASGLIHLIPGARVGMVGYFCPLVEKLIERGCTVLILEQAPQRVQEAPGVAVTRDPAELRRCDHVLCTAATLINDTLNELLAAVAGGPGLELIGPSGSGLPDPLFARGITAVGGIAFPDRSSLTALLDAGESWGAAGNKYRLTSLNYPGYAKLLEGLAV